MLTAGPSLLLLLLFVVLKGGGTSGVVGLFFHIGIYSCGGGRRGSR